MNTNAPIHHAPQATSTDPGQCHVAVIGAGMAGAACAAGLRQAGMQVSLFEKSRQVGGRMATQRALWADAAGFPRAGCFDHGALGFTPASARLRSVMARAVAAGCAGEWQPRVHSSRPGRAMSLFVALPGGPALSRHLSTGATVMLERSVRRLQRAADGAWFVASEGAPPVGPFDHVVLATPPVQAAALAAGHRDDWADALMARPMLPCWTLTAVTDDVDWPWDAAEPDHGPLAWVLRNDRVPGREAPRGLALWTAHATAEWSAAHLESPLQAVSDELQRALRSQLPRATEAGLRWHHISVHRWRHAMPAADDDGVLGRDEAWWDASLGLGVCGDFLGGGGIEGAWHSGDELADTIAASFESQADPQPLAWALG